MLQPLGITAEAEAVYVLLARLETASVGELARASNGFDVVKLRSLLESLRDLGLAIEAPGGRWQVLPLMDVVHSLRSQRLSELDSASVAAESLQNRLLASNQTKQQDDIQVLVGREAIVEARNRICDDAKKEICTFDKPPYVQARPNATPETLRATSPEWQALERGLSLRCIYHPGFDDDRLSELALFAARGEQSRTAPVPMKMFVIDRQVALIPSMRSYAPGHELRASIVRHPQLVEALQWLFEAVWDASVPIITSGFSDSDPRRQMLISLLMTGSTDSAIASQLGINVRSVRRWISELMDELGVTTRLQLGAALVRSDALRSEPIRPEDLQATTPPPLGA
jgi:sugar-specific transcriptional regulator TrmB/DNA-binding CsgD family transcriptional regulator